MLVVPRGIPVNRNAQTRPTQAPLGSSRAANSAAGGARPTKAPSDRCCLCTTLSCCHTSIIPTLVPQPSSLAPVLLASLCTVLFLAWAAGVMSIGIICCTALFVSKLGHDTSFTLCLCNPASPFQQGLDAIMASTDEQCEKLA